MKLKITKGKNYDKQAEEEVCVACNGSGYYDNTDKWGRIPKCSSCKGTGK